VDKFQADEDAVLSQAAQQISAEGRVLCFSFGLSDKTSTAPAPSPDIDELLEFVTNRCLRSLFSFSSSATRLSLASNLASRELSRAKSCATKARTAGVISVKSSGGISCDGSIAVVSQIPQISQRAVFEL
jgi:hypothetical protein